MASILICGWNVSAPEWRGSHSHSHSLFGVSENMRALPSFWVSAESKAYVSHFDATKMYHSTWRRQLAVTYLPESCKICLAISIQKARRWNRHEDAPLSMPHHHKVCPAVIYKGRQDHFNFKSHLTRIDFLVDFLFIWDFRCVSLLCSRSSCCCGKGAGPCFTRGFWIFELRNCCFLTSLFKSSLSSDITANICIGPLTLWMKGYARVSVKIVKLVNTCLGNTVPVVQYICICMIFITPWRRFNGGSYQSKKRWLCKDLCPTYCQMDVAET